MPKGRQARTVEQVLAIIFQRSEPVSSGCHIWQGSLTNSGYGRLTWVHAGRKEVGAHRVAYVATYGPVPDGLHIGRVRACVNPDQMEPVTPRENIMRSPIAPAAVNASKTSCPQGHPYSEANTVVQKHGGRLCRTCQAARPRKKASGRPPRHPVHRHHRGGRAVSLTPTVPMTAPEAAR